MGSLSPNRAGAPHVREIAEYLRRNPERRPSGAPLLEAAYGRWPHATMADIDAALDAAAADLEVEFHGSTPDMFEGRA